MKWSNYCMPATVDEARTALAEKQGALAAAGCTSFHFQAEAPDKTAVLLTGIHALKGISSTDNGFTIGATTPITDLLEFEAAGWVLKRVASQLASHQIRSISTLGGNLSRVFPWSDFPVALLALNATITLQADAERELAMDEFMKAQPANLFQPGELLTAVTIPAMVPPAGFGHVKQRMKSESFSLATASATLTLRDGRLAAPRVALGAAIAFPTRLPALETRLVGLEASDQTAMRDAIRECVEPLSFLSKEGMSREYIRELAGVTIADALQQAIEQAQGGAA